MQRTILMVRRATELPVGMWFFGQPLSYSLYQARFTDPRFPAEQHNLSQAFLGLLRPVQKQSHFLLTAYQRGELSSGGYIEASLSATLPENGEQLHGVGDSFEVVEP